MKKLFIAIASLALAFGLSGCTKEIAGENDANVVSGEKLTITFGAAETKTVNDGESFSWVSTDEISVFIREHGETPNAWTNYKFTCDDAAKGQFSCTDAAGLDPDLKYDVYAFYPYFEKLNNPAAASMNVAYNPSIDGVAGSITGKYAPLWGAAEDVDIEAGIGVRMHHIATFFKLSLTALKDITVSSITASTPAGKYCGTQVNVDATDGGAQSSTTYNSTDVTVKVTNGAIAAGNTGVFYLPLRAFSLVKGEKLSFKVNTVDNGFMIIAVETPEGGYDFAPGKVSNVARTYEQQVVLMPSVNIDTDPYTCGFETDFATTTTYNNTDEKEFGPSSAPWYTYYGTVATNSKLNGSNSMQCRWYANAASNLGYARTGFTVSTLKYVRFNAASTNKLGIALYYKGEGVADWTLAKSFEPTGSSASYGYTFDTAVKNAQLRWQIVLPETAPSSTSNIRIDDVCLASSVPADPVALTMSTVTCTEQTANSLTFSWTAVEHASGYEIYFNNVSKGTVTTTSYTATGLSASTEYTIAVKAAGDGINYTTSSAVTCKGTTLESEDGGGSDEPENYILDTTASGVKGSNNSYAGSCDITVGGIVWNLTGNSQTQPWRLGGKSLSNVDRALYSKTPMASGFSKINVTLGDATLTVNSCKLVYSTNSDFSGAKEISFSYSKGTAVTLTPSDGSGFPTGCYYKFILNVSNSTADNKYVQFTKAEFIL